MGFERTHGTNPRVPHKLNHEVTPNGVRILCSRIVGYQAKRSHHCKTELRDVICPKTRLNKVGLVLLINGAGFGR